MQSPRFAQIIELLLWCFTQITFYVVAPPLDKQVSSQASAWDSHPIS